MNKLNDKGSYMYKIWILKICNCILNNVTAGKNALMQLLILIR